MATLLSFAHHASPWLLALYVPPVLIVFASIIGTKLSHRRNARGTD